MNLSCPDCDAVYRIDPARVPEGGVTTRCRECGTHFRAQGAETAPGVVRKAELVAAGETGGSVVAAEVDSDPGAHSTGTGSPVTDAGPVGQGERKAPVFGPQDPDTRAQRLARALVSDIVVYNKERWESSRSEGTLRTEFRDEILKSWDEYVEQVGEEMAKKTPYFRDALNAILAEGQRVF